MRFRFLLSGSVCLAAAIGASIGWTGQQGSPSASPKFFEQRLRPFIETYCFKCHANEDPVGGFRLDVYRDVPSVTADRGTWEMVIEMVGGREMPPDDNPQPSLEEIESLITWIEAAVSRVDVGGPTDPGRVTARRLNRVEYANTVRDLLAVQFNPAEDFPADDVGYGFDNIGDVLSLPPTCGER